MTATHQLVAEEKIEIFAERLYGEAEQQRQFVLLTLLLAEEKRLGSYSGQLELLDRHIADGDVRIADQQTRIERMQAGGQDISQAEKSLKNFIKTREIFKGFRDGLIQSIDAINI